MSKSNNEKQTVPYPRPPKDMDTLMLTGCFGFVLVSLLAYGLSIWPYFFWYTSNRYETLGFCSLVGLLPAALLGAIGSRRFGIPGGAGSIAGALTTSVFLYIRLNEMFLGAAAHRSPEPNYPQAMTILFPLAWILVSILIAFVCLKPGEFAAKDE